MVTGGFQFDRDASYAAEGSSPAEYPTRDVSVTRDMVDPYRVGRIAVIRWGSRIDRGAIPPGGEYPAE